MDNPFVFFNLLSSDVFVIIFLIVASIIIYIVTKIISKSDQSKVAKILRFVIKITSLILIGSAIYLFININDINSRVYQKIITGNYRELQKDEKLDFLIFNGKTYVPK